MTDGKGPSMPVKLQDEIHLTFHSHKNNRTLKSNNGILQGNTSADDTSYRIQPPGYIPEFPAIQVYVGGG